ncbi:EpsG family protein [Haemophilus parainfluenzae]|jgi:wzy|uniref:EpsG family protein n=1 Tax=Haemophilus parainfluenzae TaxID=729 RepID=UPI00066D96C7|nr:EpsG family protein [Haemophilus parainfluenzae]
MLETFFIYDLMLFISIILVFFAEIAKVIKLKHVFFILALLPLFLVSALRENTGADYSHYVDIYNNLDYYNENWPLEIGFYYLNKLYMLFGLHHQFIFVTMAAIQCLFLYLCLTKSKCPSLFLASYILLFYLSSLNEMRQSLSMVIILYACFLLFENKYMKYILLVGLSSLFHNVSFLFFPLILLRFFRVSRIAMMVVIFLCYFVLSFNIIDLVLELNILSGTKYQGYLSMDEYARETNIGSGLGMIFQYFILLPFIFLRKDRFATEKYNIVVLINIFVLLSLFISIKFYIFNRILSAFSIALILSVELLVDSRLKLNKIILFLCFSFWVVLYHKDILDSNKEFGKNKQISPYTSIFHYN